LRGEREGKALKTTQRHVIIGLAALLAASTLAFGATATAGPKPAVEVKATLRGEVLPDGLVKVGDEVSEGDPLVYVKTPAGRGVAARATVDGRVLEVLVRPGMAIRELGSTVVRLDPK